MKAIVLIWLPPSLLIAHFLSASDFPLHVFAGVQAVLIVSALALAMINARTVRVVPAQLLWLLLIAVLGLATLVALTRFPELSRVPMLTPYVSVVLWTSPLIVIPLLIRNEPELRTLKRAIDWLGLAIAVTVILPAIGFDLGEVQESQVTGLRRVFGPLGDSVALLMAFYLVSAIATKTYLRACLFLVALAVTAGLGASLVFVVSAMLLAWVRRRDRVFRERPRALRTTLAAAAGVVVAIVISQGALMHRLSSPETIGFTVATRLASYRAALGVFLDNPWLGVGYTGLKAVSFRYEPENLFEVFSTNFIATAQNQLLQTGADAGLPGVVCLIAFLFASVWASRRAGAIQGPDQAHFQSYFAWGAGLCIANQTSVWFLGNSLVPFLFCTLTAISIVRLSNRETESSARDAGLLISERE